MAFAIKRKADFKISLKYKNLKIYLKKIELLFPLEGKWVRTLMLLVDRLEKAIWMI